MSYGARSPPDKHKICQIHSHIISYALGVAGPGLELTRSWSAGPPRASSAGACRRPVADGAVDPAGGAASSAAGRSRCAAERGIPEPEIGDATGVCLRRRMLKDCRIPDCRPHLQFSGNLWPRKYKRVTAMSIVT